MLVILLAILLPFAVSRNLNARTPYQVYILPEENALFTEFGHRFPGASVLTDHLEGFALPYYNLTPISLSPAHGANSSYFHQVGACYSLGNIECIAAFLNRTGFEFLYARTGLNRSYFKPVAGISNRVIYRFDRDTYQKKFK